MSACDERDPVPCKTPDELAAEETPRDKVDAWDAAHAWIGWAVVAISVLLAAGGVIRACW